MTTDRFTRVPAPVFPGISDSVTVAAGDTLYVSGAIGFEEGGVLPADFGRAVELTFIALGAALERGGATFSDLARINIYIVDLSPERLAVFREVRDRFIDPENIPASSLIGVAALVGGAQVEVDAVAAV